MSRSRVTRVNALQLELVDVSRQMEIQDQWLEENAAYETSEIFEEHYDEYMTLEFTASVLGDLVAINMSADAIEVPYGTGNDDAEWDGLTDTPNRTFDE